MGHYRSEMADDVGRVEVREMSPSEAMSAELPMMLVYSVPLAPRDGRRAHLSLPSDLTTDEARRLCAVVNAVAFPESSPTGDPA